MRSVAGSTTTDDCVVRRSPVRGRPLDAGALALSGLEIMERYRDRRLPGPSMAHLTGLLVIGAGAGTVTATMPVSPWLRWSRGRVPPPVLALLADTPLGAACQTLLPPGSLLATAQMALAFTSAVLNDGDTVTAVGSAAEAVSPNAMRSRVAMCDGDGATVAEGTALMAVRTVAGTLPDADGRSAAGHGPAPATDEGGLDPYQCPPQGVTLPPELLRRLRGVDLVAGLASGDLPAPPLQRLCGVRPVDAREGASVWRMPAVPWLSSVVPDEVYGGATAMLAGMTALGTAETLSPAGCAAELGQLTVRLRSRAVTDGGDLVAHGAVLRHVDGEMAVRVHAMDRRGNVVATALASCHVVEQAG